MKTMDFFSMLWTRFDWLKKKIRPLQQENWLVTMNPWQSRGVMTKSSIYYATKTSSIHGPDDGIENL